MDKKSLSVPRWKASQLEPRFFWDAYYMRSQPVIITDLATKWPAVGKWTPDFLVENHGDVEAVGLAWEGDQIDDFLHYTRYRANLRHWAEVMLQPKENKRAYVT